MSHADKFITSAVWLSGVLRIQDEVHHGCTIKIWTTTDGRRTCRPMAVKGHYFKPPRPVVTGQQRPTFSHDRWWIRSPEAFFRALMYFFSAARATRSSAS